MESKITESKNKLYDDCFSKVYTKITQITKATCTLNAQGVGNDELAIVRRTVGAGREDLGNDITLQVFSGTEGIPTNAEVTFLGKAPTLRVGDDLCGRFLMPLATRLMGACC